MSQTTERRRHALSTRAIHDVRVTTPTVLHLVEPNAIILADRAPLDLLD